MVLPGHQLQTGLFSLMRVEECGILSLATPFLERTCSTWLGLSSPPSGVCKVGSAPSVVTQAEETKGEVDGRGVGAVIQWRGLSFASDISPADVRSA